MKKIVISLTSAIIIIFLILLLYIYSISAVTKNSSKVTLEIAENSTYYSIASLLKENNLIRSELSYKIYIKLNKPNNLQAGKYELDSNMNLDEIIKTLENNEIVIEHGPTFLISEGKHITDVAYMISTVSNLNENDLLEYWSNDTVLDELINKYWFITDEVKNSKLRYNLEGYFFPATYEIASKDVSSSYVTYMMLDKTNEILSKYKTEIENSNFSVHEILTLASIVENEAILSSDRPKIARVFLNRLNNDMPLQSCATIGYAINEWKLTYTFSDLSVDSPYNTYKYLGLPVGPGNMPGEDSIKAVLYPDDNDYLYFLANVYDSSDNKTYYSRTYFEHQQKCLEYLNKAC